MSSEEELKREIAELRDRISRLEAKVEDLSRRFEALFVLQFSPKG